MADKSKHIDQKIKEGFDTIQRKAPEGLWENIAPSASLSNDEQIIQDSFQNIEKKAPVGGWGKVKRQVIIDEVWDKILLHQDRRKRRVFWLWFAGSASVVLLLISLALFNSDSVNSNGNKHGVTSEIDLDSEKNDGIEGEPNHNESQNVKDAENPPSSIGHVTFPSSNEIGVPDKDLLSTVNIQTNIDSITMLDSLETTEFDPYRFMVTNDGIEEMDSVSKLPYRELNALTFNNSESKIAFRPITPLIPPRRFEAGIIVGAGSSWLFNNDVKNGFNSSSLIQNKFSLGYSFGVNVNYNFIRRSALEVGYDVYSIHQEKYSYYEAGRLIDKNIKFREQKLSLAYKYRLRNNSMKNRIFVVKGGAFFAHSIKEETSMNWVKTTLNESFESIDYGLIIGAGIEHRLGPIKIEYGLKSDIGLHNITANTLELPKKFDYATTFILGGYLSVRYLF
ncbi:MAG: hypothetical protein ACJASQ_003307 [Crocinitomicaceae bacterium]|jgi:hypothetical protein